MNEVEQLKHRIAMIEDDLKVIRSFIHDNGLSAKFETQTPMADECWTHLNNIEIACDLTDSECLDWELFNKK